MVPSRTVAVTSADQWTCESILKAVEQVYPIEAQAPHGLLASLRPYQAQSLAHMLENERSVDLSLCVEVEVRDRRGVDMIPRQGGWLCDEMGMGRRLHANSRVVTTCPVPCPMPHAHARGCLSLLLGRQDLCMRRSHLSES